MDEIKSGSILKSVPEEMRPCPEIKSLETAKGNYSQRTIIHIVGSVRYAQTFKPPYQTDFNFYFHRNNERNKQTTKESNQSFTN